MPAWSAGISLCETARITRPRFGGKAVRERRAWRAGLQAHLDFVSESSICHSPLRRAAHPVCRMISGEMPCMQSQRRRDEVFEGGNGVTFRWCPGNEHSEETGTHTGRSAQYWTACG